MLDPEQLKAASTAVREFRVSLSNFFLYSAENAMVQQVLDRFIASLAPLLEAFPSVSLGESEGHLVVEGTLLDESLTGPLRSVKDLFLNHKIHSLTFARGLRRDEVMELFDLLRPGALASGVSLSQRLVLKPLEHIHVNEKVYVALKAGEKSSNLEEARKTGEESLKEAMEALQYFLQVFARVQPGMDRQELAKKLKEQTGDWLGTPEAGRAEADNQQWLTLMSGLWNLKRNIDTQDAAADVDDLLKKVYSVLETRGIDVAEGNAARQDRGGEPGADAVMTAIDSGQVDVFTDPALEKQTAAEINRLLRPDMAEAFQDLWESLWTQVHEGDARSQGLCIRQLGRLKWAKVPETHRFDGFKNLKKAFQNPRFTANYPAALDLLKGWMTYELENSHWMELSEMAWFLKELSVQSPPLFEGQDKLAQEAMGSVFTPLALEGLYVHYEGGAGSREQAARLFSALGPIAGDFLLGKIGSALGEGKDWEKSRELLVSMGEEAVRLMEEWMSRPHDEENLGKIIDIFGKVAPPPGWCAYCVKNWPNFSPKNRVKALGTMEAWPRKEFHPLLLSFLDPPDRPEAVRALAVLASQGEEGDARAVIAAIKNYPARSQGRERFWTKACQALGEFADPLSINPLTEWAEGYKFLESRKERGPEVRKAAILALGSFASQSVKTFLMKLREEGDKEIGAAVEQSLKKVEEKLRQKTGEQNKEEAQKRRNAD